MPAQPRLELLYTLTAELGAPTQIPGTSHGHRIIVPVTGGSFEGEQLRGKVHPGGADWLLLRADGVGELDVRATMETHDGALIYVAYRGYVTNVPSLLPRWSQGQAIPREEYYFAVTPYFETNDSRYAWLQQTVVLGIGELIRGGVRYDIYAVRESM
jgi:hypothetical protein